MTQPSNPDGGQFAQLVAELRELPVAPGVHVALAELLCRFNGTRISAAALAQEERVAAAVRMLAAGNDRPTVRDRLASTYRTSKRTAERDIAVALARRRPPAPARPPAG